MSKFPQSVSHDDFVEAARPLMELLGTSPNDVWADDCLRIFQRDGDMVIEFASAVDPEDGSEPGVVGEGEFAAKSWPVEVIVYR